MGWNSGLGHILIKASQILVAAGLQHMLRERASYRWLNSRKVQHGFNLDDWLRAKQDILRWMKLLGD
jgi:hypothetical protein